MAANLNVPSQFSSTRIKDSSPHPPYDKLDLMPPAAFEKGSAGDPWRDLARATSEIMQLKLENQKLREKPPAPIFVPAVPEHNRDKETLMFSQHPGTQDMKYIDELITKQATEITDLKKDLGSLKCSHKEEMAELEKQSAIKERQYVQTTASLESELKAAEERYDMQVDRLSHEQQQELEDVNNTVDRLTEELSKNKSTARTRISELEQELQEVRHNLSSTVGELQQELRLKETTVENQTKQISQLKTYIGETERGPKPAEVWRKEKETLENKLMISEADRERLQSTVQLLNIRLSSMNEILSLQESELSKNQADVSEKSKQDLLLTRWREKVFALMVQQKSLDISSRKGEQNWKEKVINVQNSLSSAVNQIDMLTHALSDKKAELEMEQNDNTKLGQEVTEAQQVAICLDNNLQEYRHSVNILQAFAASVDGRCQEVLERLQTMMGTVKSYNQRISFASSRVQMLQGLFARQEALRKLQDDNSLQSPENTVQCGDLKERGDEIHLQSELDQVTRERDSLVVKVRQDSEMWEERLHNTRSQYEEENCNLKRTVEELEIVLQEKSQCCISLSDRLDCAQSELGEERENLEALKIDLGKHQIVMEQAMEEQRKTMLAEFAEQSAEMDRKLNEARREHTKAVVSLRQLERQSSREKERSAEHLKTVEDHFTRHIENLQEQIRAVEKERNLMMATLRQEGLIGKVRSERGEPLNPSLTDAPEEHQETATPTLELPSQMQDKTSDIDEPLTSVLEDLKNLTSAVMEDEGSGSDT